ncbi:MAG: ThiF family adenylyltransferase [Anaerolineae bacterium]|nr:ThiF family adenylyltransferase [Anaerolineae bacterium]
MDYTLALTRHAAATMETHLLGDRRTEQMAVTLCGVSRMPHEVRLLVRDVILLPPDAFRRQSIAQLELKPEVQAFIHRRADEHGLVQVDWHSHPGGGSYVAFSPTDDRYEAAQAAYLAHKMNGVPYGSVVVNEGAMDARLWITRVSKSARRRKQAQPAPITYRPQAHPLQAILSGDLQRRIPVSTQRLQRAGASFISPIFDRQVRAFGQAFQRKMNALRVGVVGLGAMGGAMVEHLARLGVREWVLVDPDVVTLSNLNRLVNATTTDAQKARPKVNVARSTVRQVTPKAYVRALQADVFDPEAQRALKSCDLLIAATDNHSSRVALNRLAVQYLIPLVHLGFNVTVEPKGREVADVSGEVAIPDLGRWCLQCAGIVNLQQAGWELASPDQRALLRQRGYVDDTPAPAVHHLDGVVAALAAAEIHNLVHAFRPQQRYLVYDALQTKLVPLQVTPSENCPVCSAEHGVLGLGDLEPLPDYRRASRVQLPPPRRPAEETAAGTGGKAAAPPAKQENMAVFQLATPLPDRQERARRMQAAMAEDEEEWE